MHTFEEFLGITVFETFFIEKEKYAQE